MSHLGRLFYSRRSGSGLSVKDMAQLAGYTNIPRGMRKYGAIEDGRQVFPRPESVRRFALILGIEEVETVVAQCVDFENLDRPVPFRLRVRLAPGMYEEHRLSDGCTREEAETIAEEEPPGYEPPSETYKRIILEHLGKPSVPGLPPLMPLGVLREVAMMLDEERAEQLVEDLHAGRLDGPEEQEQPPVEQAGTPAEEDEPGPVEPPVGELSVGLEDNATMPRTRPGPAIPTTRTLPPSSSFWRS